MATTERETAVGAFENRSQEGRSRAQQSKRPQAAIAMRLRRAGH